MSKKPTSYADVLKQKEQTQQPKKFNLFDFSSVKTQQPTQTPQLNFGQPISKRNVTNFQQPTQTQPTQKSGLSLVPTANAEFGQDYIGELEYDIKNGATIDEILKSYPEVKGNRQLVNELIYDIQNGATMDEIKQAYPELGKDKGPDGFTGAVMGTVEGAISQVPAFAANLGGAFNKYVTAPAAGVLGENLFGVPREQNPLYTGAMKLAGETQKTGEELKQGVKKFGVAKNNTTSQKVGEELTNIGGSLLIPGGFMQKGVPLGSQLTRGAVQGVTETMKYTAGARGELPTGTEAVVGAVLPVGLGVLGNQFSKVKNKLMVSGLMTPAKLTQAKQRIITEVGENAANEFEKVVKTPDDVSKWLLDRGIKGDKEEIIQQLIKNAENSKAMVDNQLASVNEYIAAGAPEMDNARKALDVLFDAYKDDIGNQGIFKQITNYISKLQEKGGGLTVSEMNDIKRLIDRSELNPYTLVGKVRAGKSGLNNIRNGLKQDIENIAERNGVEGIKMLNNNTSVSRFIAEAIGKKNDSEMARELVSVFAPRLVGGAIGGTTGGPFNEKTTEGKIGNFLFGAFVGGALGSTKFKTNLASFINKLTPSEKGAIQSFINSRGQSNLPKDIYNKLLNFREGNKIISKETKNVSNIDNNLSNNIQLKKSVLSPREKSLLKPNQPKNVSNKPIKPFNKSETTNKLQTLTKDNVDDIAKSITTDKTKLSQVKAVIQKYLKEYGDNIKNYLGLLADDIADIVGVRAKLLGGEKAKLFDKSRWQQAKEMTNAGKSADDIWKETGWEKGTDGKWRFEIDDSKAKLKDGLDLDYKKTKEYLLKDVLEHDDLFKQYPNLKEIKIIDDPKYDGMGEFTPGIESDNFFRNPSIKLNIIKMLDDGDSPKSTLLHEIQHYIQSKEGFARGGNVETAIATKDFIKKINNQIDTLKKDIEVKNDLLKSNDIEFNAELDGYKDIEKYKDFLKKEIYKSSDKIKKLENYDMSELDKFEGYKKLAGETEARNVQSRLLKTPSERKLLRPAKTEDVARKFQIIKKN